MVDARRGGQSRPTTFQDKAKTLYLKQEYLNLGENWNVVWLKKRGELFKFAKRVCVPHHNPAGLVADLQCLPISVAAYRLNGSTHLTICLLGDCGKEHANWNWIGKVRGTTAHLSVSSKSFPQIDTKTTGTWLPASQSNRRPRKSKHSWLSAMRSKDFFFFKSSRFMNIESSKSFVGHLQQLVYEPTRQRWRGSSRQKRIFSRSRLPFCACDKEVEVARVQALIWLGAKQHARGLR